MGKERNKALIKQLLELINLKDAHGIDSAVDLLFQVSWRATEIDWGEKYSKSKIISEREWRALEGLSRALSVENLPQKEQIIYVIKQELAELIPKLTSFLSDNGVVNDTNAIPNLCTLVEYVNDQFYFSELARRLDKFIQQQIDAGDSYHVKALFRMFEIIGEYLKWINPELKTIFKEITEILGTIRNDIQHKKYRAEKIAKDQELINGIVKEDLQKLLEFLQYVSANYSNCVGLAISNETIIYRSSIVNKFGYKYPYIRKFKYILEESHALPCQKILSILELTLTPAQKQLLHCLVSVYEESFDFAQYYKLIFGDNSNSADLDRPSQTQQNAISNHKSQEYKGFKAFITSKVEAIIKDRNMDKKDGAPLQGIADQILSNVRKQNYAIARKLALQQLNIQIQEWDKFIPKDLSAIPVGQALCGLIMSVFNVTFDKVDEIRLILIDLRNRFIKVRKSAADLENYFNFLKEHVGLLLKLNEDQGQLWKILARQIRIENKEELLNIMLKLNITPEEINTYLGIPGQMQQPTIWRYIEFDRPDTVGLEKSTSDILQENIDNIFIEFKKLSEIAARYPYSQKKYDRLPELFADDSLYYLAVQKLFEELEDTIAKTKIRDNEDQLFFKHAYKSITVQQFFLIKQVRNQIAHRPETLDSERMAWFFEKWLTCMAPELRLRQFAPLEVQENPTENHCVVSELNQIAEHTAVVRHFAISLGFTDEILVRGRLIKDSIGIQGDLDLIVKFRDSSVPRKNIFELENTLGQYFSIHVQICTKETLAQRIMITQPRHLQQAIHNAKDLLSIRLDLDKRQHLLDGCWYHLTMRGIDKPIKAIDCRGKIWTEEEIESITTILLFPNDEFLREQAELRKKQLTPYIKKVILQKAQKFAILLIKAVYLCKDTTERKTLLTLLKDHKEICLQLVQYYIENRAEIFAFNPELTIHAFIHNFVLTPYLKVIPLFGEVVYDDVAPRTLIKDQTLINNCQILVQRLRNAFAPSIRATQTRGIYHVSIEGAWSPQQQKRIALERIFNICLLLFDEIKNPAIIEYFLSADNDQDKLITLINKDFTERFLDPLEEADQSIRFEEVEFLYLKPGFFQEVMQEEPRNGTSLIFDDIEINCRFKVQLLKLGYKPATAEMICTIENMEQFLPYHYVGKIQMLQTQMREYSYPELSSLNELLVQHGIKSEVYSNFEEDSQKFAFYLEFNRLLCALTNLEKERIFYRLEIAKKEFYMIRQDGRDRDLLDLSKYSIFECLQQIDALRQMQCSIIMRLVNTNFINYKRKHCVIQNFDSQLITELLNQIFPEGHFVQSNLPPEIDIISILKKEHDEREQEFLRILVSQKQQEIAVAFASGCHPRLGHDGPIFLISSESSIVEAICKYSIFGAGRTLTLASNIGTLLQKKPRELSSDYARKENEGITIWKERLIALSRENINSDLIFFLRDCANATDNSDLRPDLRVLLRDDLRWEMFIQLICGAISQSRTGANFTTNSYMEIRKALDEFGNLCGEGKDCFYHCAIKTEGFNSDYYDRVIEVLDIGTVVKDQQIKFDSENQQYAEYLNNIEIFVINAYSKEDIKREVYSAPDRLTWVNLVNKGGKIDSYKRLTEHDIDQFMQLLFNHEWRNWNKNIKRWVYQVPNSKICILNTMQSDESSALSFDSLKIEKIYIPENLADNHWVLREKEGTRECKIDKRGNDGWGCGYLTLQALVEGLLPVIEKFDVDKKRLINEIVGAGGDLEKLRNVIVKFLLVGSNVDQQKWPKFLIDTNTILVASQKQEKTLSEPDNLGNLLVGYIEEAESIKANLTILDEKSAQINEDINIRRKLSEYEDQLTTPKTMVQSLEDKIRQQEKSSVEVIKYTYINDEIAKLNISIQDIRKRLPLLLESDEPQDKGTPPMLAALLTKNQQRGGLFAEAPGFEWPPRQPDPPRSLEAPQPR